jgi:hypothetical protein
VPYRPDIGRRRPPVAAGRSDPSPAGVGFPAGIFRRPDFFGFLPVFGMFLWDFSIRRTMVVLD